MSTYTQVIPAGESRIFPGGSHMSIIKGAGIEVEFLRNNTAVRKASANVGPGFYYGDSENPFSAIKVTSATAQTVQLFIDTSVDSGYRATTSLITDLVNVNQQTEAETLLDKAFSLHYSGAMQAMQLFNPAASGVNLLLDEIRILNPAATVTHYLEFQSGTIQGTSGIVTQTASSKLIDASPAVSKGQFEYVVVATRATHWTPNTVAPLTGAFYHQPIVAYAGIDNNYKFDRPYVITPGYAIGFWLAAAHDFTFTWRERAV